VPAALPAGRRGIILIGVVGVNLFLRCGAIFLLTDRDAGISMRVLASVSDSPKVFVPAFRTLDVFEPPQRNVSGTHHAERAIDTFQRAPTRLERRD